MNTIKFPLYERRIEGDFKSLRNPPLPPPLKKEELFCNLLKMKLM
jgi:hypothetical protein